MTWFVLASGIASVIGCGLSFWQACKAKKSAGKAEECKNVIQSKATIFDISELVGKLTSLGVCLLEYKKQNKSPKGRDKIRDEGLFNSTIMLLNTKIPLIKDCKVKEKIDNYYNQLQNANMIDDVENNVETVNRIIRLLSEYQNEEKYK